MGAEGGGDPLGEMGIVPAERGHRGAGGADLLVVVPIQLEIAPRLEEPSEDALVPRLLEQELAGKRQGSLTALRKHQRRRPLLRRPSRRRRLQAPQQYGARQDWQDQRPQSPSETHRIPPEAWAGM